MLGHRLTERGFKHCKVGKASTRGWAGLRLLPEPSLTGQDEGPADGAGADTSGQADTSGGVLPKLLQDSPTAMKLSKKPQYLSAPQDLSAPCQRRERDERPPSADEEY